MSQDQDLELYPALLGRTHENLFVGDEKPADFYALLNSLLERYLPDSGHVRALVEDAAIARWHLWRHQRVVHRREQELFTTQSDQSDPGQWMSGVFHSLQILQRYKNAADLSCRRAYANLEAIRKENARAQRWQLSFNVQKQRHELAQRKYDDVAAETQAKGKLAAIKTNQVIAHENEQQLRSCRGYERPSVVQKIAVSVANGITITSRKPSNKDIMAELAERAHHLYPPEQVVREFKFLDFIPSEYDWIVAGKSDRAMSSCIQLVPLDDWHKIAPVESETGHAIGDPPEES